MLPYWQKLLDQWERDGRPEKKAWAIAHHLNPHTFRRVTNQARVMASDARSPEHTIPLAEDKPPSWEEGPEYATASSDSDTITSPEQLIAAAGIDMKLWRIDHHQVKTYQGYRADKQKDLTYVEGKATGTVYDAGNIRLVTMWSVKVWFVRREEAPVENAIESLLAQIRKEAPRVPPLARRPAGDHMLLPMITDAHFGRLTLDSSYTPEHTEREMGLAIDAIIARALGMGVSIGEILFPAGNDAINVDTAKNTTTRGTWQQQSGAVQDALQAAYRAHVYAVSRLVEVAPVRFVSVPGNHDNLLAFALAMMIAARFHNDKRVTVDIDKEPRKYHRYGKTLIGMEHGDRTKPEALALTMAQERPQMWVDTKYRLFLRGHFHHEKEMLQLVKGVGTVQVVTFPAFCPPDEWEKVMGFLGSHRAAEGRLFHIEHGPAMTFPVFVDELEKTEAKRGGQSRQREAVAAGPIK